jgi:hydroxymethylpyrimidine/phosphomethylpyrimidine kinase
MKNILHRRTQYRSALTVAGSDSGGGAGIQADLKTFAALQVHGVTAITCVTAQNPAGVRSVHPLPPGMVVDQMDAVMEAFRPAAIKTGMLYSAGVIEAVAERLSSYHQPVIVDPVMVATSGAILLKPSARKALTSRLFPAASLITPNLPEAEALLGRTISSPEDLRDAAREFHARYGCAILLKGGHLPSMKTAADIYFDGLTELLLEAPFVRGISTHGTGCTYSAAIAAWCARGKPLPEAVIAAKEFISNAIAASGRVNKYDVLNSFWSR